MRKIMKDIKVYILNKQIDRCELRIILLDAKVEKYHDIIVDKIIKGDDKVQIEILRMKKRKLNDRIIKLIERKYEFKRQLIWA